jgi:hypothetical protein
MLSRISKISRAGGASGLQRSAAALRSISRWHFLYFLPLPHQQGAFLPGTVFVIDAPDSVYVEMPVRTGNLDSFTGNRGMSIQSPVF